MVRLRAAHAKRTAREKTALLATTHGEAVEEAQRVFAMGDELMAMRRARDVAEGKILSLAAKTAAVDPRRGAIEEQCERLVHGLTLLSLRGFEAPCTRGCAL
jgi:hypothetical protein